MQYDEEADAVECSDVLLGNNGNARTEPNSSKRKGGFAFAAGMLVFVLATLSSNHVASQERLNGNGISESLQLRLLEQYDPSSAGHIDADFFFESSGVSYHPERSTNLGTFKNDFIEKEVFDSDSIDPWEKIISDLYEGTSDEMIITNDELNGTRVLQEYPIPDYLYPLPCNDVTFDCTTTPLSSLPVPTDGSPLVIECGTCVYVDTIDGGQLDLPNGLRIEGKLYFPPEASITIRTIFVMVLGILKMDNPLAGNEVKFSLYGEEDIFFTADPSKQDPITSQCVNGCKIGKKAIAVLGGQLDIQGIDPECPSWENLLDISTSGTKEPSAAPTVTPAPTIDPNSVCAGNLFLNGDFSADPNSASPSKGYANNYEMMDDDLNPGNRIAASPSRPNWAGGFYQDLATECFLGGEKWKIEMDIRMIDPLTNQGIDCNPSDTGLEACPFALVNSINSAGAKNWASFYDVGMEWNKDGWNHFSVVVDDQSFWTSLSKFRLMLLGGPAGSTFLIDNVSFELFDGSEVPSNVGGVTVDPNNQIHLSQKAAECWTPGSEILITSNSERSRDYQIATIESTDPFAGTIQLTSRIDPVSTVASDPNHAVEVALLSRRIIFEADDDQGDELMGGHLIVMLTPQVVQHLEGVEIRNFGQQGNLGRYPVHFHLCEDATGSVVKKNVVRQSNQRCYVMHGTNGVLIEDNVAFDTFGHCFMTEDGVEHSNRFIRNLGAHTKNAARLLDAASKRKESDNFATTFWMSNMENDFEGNVAAGTESHGFWAETHFSMVGRGGSIYQRPDHQPMYANLGSFKDNTAHSFDTTGFTSYPPGWLPEDNATIENFRAYRGKGTGIFLHNTQKLTFIGGYVGLVEYLGIFVFGADDLIFDGMELVGNFEEERLCKHGQHRGVVLSPHRAPTKGKPGQHFGTKLKNLNFNNWWPADGCDTSLVDISTTQIRSPAWDAYNLMENVIHDGSNPILASACRYEDLYASDAAIEVSGDATTVYGGSGFLVGSLHVPLLGSTGGCNDVGGCLHFCPGACLRTIKFYTSGARDVWSYKMKVSDGINTITVDRWYTNFDGPTLERRYSEYSSYSVSLPAGNFEVWFEDENDPGVIVFPKFVTPVFEIEPSCSDFATEASITILKPPAEDPRCDDLIHNGDFTLSTEGWQEWDADFFFGETAGVQGTGALVTKTTTTETRVVQWLDMSCLVENAGVYLFQASYRIVDQVDDIAAAEDLPNAEEPFVHLLFAEWDEVDQKMKTSRLPSSYLDQSFVPPTQAPTSAPTQSPTSAAIPTLGQIQTVKVAHLEDITPLTNCQGNCHTDDDCQGDLACFERDALEPVPGCAGEGSQGTNYCYDPYNPESTGFKVLSGALTITPEQAAGVSSRLQFHNIDSNFILDHVSLVKAPWSDDNAGDGIFV